MTAHGNLYPACLPSLSLGLKGDLTAFTISTVLDRYVKKWIESFNSIRKSWKESEVNVLQTDTLQRGALPRLPLAHFSNSLPGHSLPSRKSGAWDACGFPFECPGQQEADKTKHYPRCTEELGSQKAQSPPPQDAPSGQPISTWKDQGPSPCPSNRVLF